MAWKQHCPADSAVYVLALFDDFAADVEMGVKQVPESPLRVVAGDSFSVSCLANWHVYRASSLHWVTAGSNVPVTSRAHLNVVTFRFVSSTLQNIFVIRNHREWCFSVCLFLLFVSYCCYLLSIAAK